MPARLGLCLQDDHADNVQWTVHPKGVWPPANLADVPRLRGAERWQLNKVVAELDGGSVYLQIARTESLRGMYVATALVLLFVGFELARGKRVIFLPVVCCLAWVAVI